MNSCSITRRRVSIFAGAMVMLALFGALPASSFAAAGDWAQLGYGSAHNANQRDETLLSRTTVRHLSTAYRIQTGYVGGPVAAGGTLFMPLRVDTHTNYFPYLLAMNAKTGTTLWKRPLDEAALDFSPAVARDMVYITTPRETELGRAGSLYAFDAKTGTQLWRKTGTAQASPVVADGLVFVAGGEQGGPYSLVAYDATTGAVRWRVPVGFVGQETTAAVAGGRVFIVTQGTVFAFAEQTGAPLWRRVVPGESSGAPTVASGLVLVGGYRGLHALDATTGAPVWSFLSVTGLHFVQGRVAVARGAVYVDIDNQLDALTLADGAYRWQRTIVSNPNAAVEASPAVANAVIYVSGWVNGTDGLLAFGRGGGHLRSIVTKGTDPIVSNGRVYLGNYQYVSAFQP